MDVYRGLIIRFAGKDLELVHDGMVIVEDGKIAVADSIPNLISTKKDLLEKQGFRIEGDSIFLHDKEVSPTQQVIMPPTTNLHDHSFQPPGIPGELIVFDERVKQLVGWLPTTLKEGEYAAKQDKEVARRMIKAKLEKFASNGVGSFLEYTTSSVEATEVVLEEAKNIGLRVVAGYVCMDQGMDDIQVGLQTSAEEAIKSTEYLLKTYGSERIAVIDRFPIAVSSPTRKRLAEMAREHGALFDTHMDESVNEKNIHEEIYGTQSIATTLLDDGVFEPGSRVGLAHAIHTKPEEMERLKKKMQEGCVVSIRACPNSNAHLGSHWDGDTYVEFPLDEWEATGALITLGTDQGAGRGWNIFDEMLDEKRRHPISRKPSHVNLLRYGTLNGLLSLGVDPNSTNIIEGNHAEFVVVRMAGAKGFYEPGSHDEDLETVAARVIEGGERSTSVLALYVNGRKIK